MQTENSTATKENPNNSKEKILGPCVGLNENHLTIISKITTEVVNNIEDEVRRIFREERERALKEISRKPQYVKKRSKKSNERVTYIRKEIWPSIEKFRKTPNEPIGDTLSKMAKAAIQYLERGGSLEALEGQTNNLQNSNNQE